MHLSREVPQGQGALIWTTTMRMCITSTTAHTRTRVRIFYRCVLQGCLYSAYKLGLAMPTWYVTKSRVFNLFPLCMSSAGLYGEDPLIITPQKHSELMNINQHIAHSLSISDDGSLEHSPQISPASVLPTHNESPLKACNLFNSARPVLGRLHNLSLPSLKAC
jgi:hypothetical protein